jgi:hypothetical protein
VTNYLFWIISQKGGVKKQLHTVNWDRSFDKLAADKRRQPQTFSPADLAGLKLPSLRE